MAIFQDILSKLQGVHGSGTQFTAKCPAHEDRQNSLSVGISDNGERILLNCFANCPTESIVDKLGLNMSDLFTAQAAPKPQKVNNHTYEYHDTSGTLLYRKTRVDYSDGTKNFFFKQPNGAKGIKGVQRVPYNLPAVIAAQTVYFVEGEKCADAIIKAGRTATTLDSGAKSKWLPEYADHFKDKTVIVIPDNDAPGMEYAQRIRKQLPGSKVATIPGLADKEDIYDWLHAGHTMDEFDALPISDEPLPKEETEEKEPRAATQAEILLKLVEGTGADFFHSDTNDLYATLPVGQHREVWPLDGKDFGTWLHRLYYKETGRPVNNEAVGQTVAVLSAAARFDRPEPITLSTRTAEYKSATDNTVIWYDLTNPAWQAIKVTAEGWKIYDNPPLLFNRYRHQAAQITPQPGGDIKRILRHVNLKDQYTLFMCWLVCCFIPGIPHTMPIFYGEKGAAKSTTCCLLKTLIDPSALETLTLQNDPRALAVNLQQHWFLPFDNVSHINEETSDTLCRAITGGGIQQRKLFTNSEDTIFTFKRCLALNGINNVATRPDLLDRSLLIELERISEIDRRELADIHAAFEADRPAILGGILDTLAQAMAIFPSVSLDRLPRMADFARWGYAIGEALGGHGETFLAEYAANRESQNTEAINADPIAALVVAFMGDHDTWEGKVSELLTELSEIAPQQGINPRSKGFPTQPNHLSRRLRGIKSNLEAVGIAFDSAHTMNGTILSLKRQNLSSSSSYRHKPSDINGLRHDDNMTVNDDKNSSSYLSSYSKPSVFNAYDGHDDNDDKITTFTRDLRRGRI